MQGALKPGRNPHKNPHPPNCVDCGVPILSRKRFAEPPAGYQWHQGKGRCGKCYSRQRPPKDLGIGHPKLPTPVAASAEEIARREAANRRDFVRYILARRKRMRRADLSLRGIEGLEQLEMEALRE